LPELLNNIFSTKASFVIKLLFHYLFFCPSAFFRIFKNYIFSFSELSGYQKINTLKE